MMANPEIHSPETLPALSVSQITASLGVAEVTLSDDEKAHLIALVTSYRQSARRMVREFITMSHQLHEMEKLLGRGFIPFATQYLNISQATVFRYLRIYTGMTLMQRGMPDCTPDFDQFTQGALCLIGGQTDDDLLTEIQQLAGQGEKINETVVREVIARRNRQSAAELAVEIAASEKLKQELETLRTKREVEANRHKLDIIIREDLLCKRADELKIAYEEVARLMELKTIIKEVEVHRIPAGYRSMQEAAAVKNGQLRSKDRALIAKASQLEQLKAEEARLMIKITALKDGDALIDAYVLAVNALIAQFPAPVVKQLMQDRPDSHAGMVQLVSQMTEYVAELTRPQ